MSISLRYRSFISFCSLCLVFLGFTGVSKAQTETPTPTITRTPVLTFTPSPTFDVSLNRFNCPDEIYYYDEVDIRYIAQCSHCLQERPRTKVAFGNDIPDAPIGLSPLPVTPLGTQGTPSPSPTVPLTYVPTRTPFWMGTVTFTPTNTLPPTPTALTTGVSTFTPSPTLSPTATYALYITEVVDFSTPDLFGAVSRVDGSVHSSLTGSFWNATQEAWEFSGWPEIREMIQRSNYRDNVLGMELFYRWSGSSAAGSDVRFTFGNLQVTRSPSNTYFWFVPTPTPALRFQASSIGVGNDNNQRIISVFVPEWETTTPTPIVGDDTFFYVSSGSSSMTNPMYIDKIVYTLLNPEIPPPTLIPTETLTPTLTPTPTSSPTPNPNEVDCRFPFNHSDTPIFETDLTDSYSIVQQECYVIIPSGWGIDLSAFNPDWVIELTGLQLCISFFTLPSFSIMGVSIPVGGLFIAILVGFIFRRFATF